MISWYLNLVEPTAYVEVLFKSSLSAMINLPDPRETRAAKTLSSIFLPDDVFS